MTQSLFPQRRDPITDKVSAQPQQWGVQAAASGNELEGLVRGLSELNPALQNYGAELAQAARIDTEKQKAGISALAQAESDRLAMQQGHAAEFAGNPTPAQVPLALQPLYREAFHKALGEREGIMTKDSTLAAYTAAKEKPDFNVEAFLAQQRNTALQGLEGVPMLASQVGNQVNQAEVQIRADAQRQALLKHTETRNAAIAQTFADGLRADLTPDDLYATYITQLRPRAEALGLSKKDAAGFLVNQLVAVSTKMGGNPAIFDILDRKDESGISIASSNPELQNQVMTARHAASTQAASAMKAASQKSNFETMARLEDVLRDRPEAITLDLIKANMGPAAAFSSHDEANAFYQRAQRALNDNQGTAALQANYDNGTMYLLDAGDQKKLLDANLGPYAVKLSEAAQKGDTATVTQLAQTIMLAQSKVKAKAPLTSLEQFIATTVTSLPGKAPSPAFESAAALYKALSGDPSFRDMYFKGDIGTVMDGYISGMGSGDKQAAYEGAYRAISPESRAAAAKLTDSPEFKKNASNLYKSVRGSSAWPQLFGGDGRPESVSTVSMAAAYAVKDFYSKNPNASDKDVERFAATWVQANFVHDTSTRTAVRIPPEFSGPITQIALSDYSKKTGDEFRSQLSEADRDDWRVNFLPTGDTGKYEVVMQNGSAIKHIGPKSLTEMITDYRMQTQFTEAERTTFGVINQQLRAGAVEPGLLAANADVLAKARAMKIPGVDFVRLDKLRSDAMLERIRTIPLMGLGTPDSSRLQFIPQRGARVDNKLTAQTAQGFLTQAVASPTAVAPSLAGSLITLAEGTALQSYPDPNPAAGNNIGMGYNLKANAGNAQADLKRAGVPEDKVRGVLDGSVQLTTDQARQLLNVTLPRYTETARKGAESAQPGLWAKMTPHQQAVMTDIAYSVGSADQFKQAWKAIADGDSQRFKAAVMTTYVNKDGKRVEDTRRFNLRAAMLAGTATWSATVAQYGGFPSNQLDSLALK